MDTFGNDLSYGGQVLTKSELISRRERNGECTNCGQKCFNKKLFKMVPITIPGVVLEGRCLACNPQDPSKEEVVAAVVVAAQAVALQLLGMQDARQHGAMGVCASCCAP